MELQEAHDALIANMPSGVEHDIASCPFCSSLKDGEGINDFEGGDIVSTYTKEDLETAVSEATAPLQAELDELRSHVEQETLTLQLEDLKAQHVSEIAELQAKLDTAVLEGESEKTKYLELVAMIEGKANEEIAAAIFAAVCEDRVAQVKEVASFPEDYIETNTVRWAAMEQEAFESLVSDWKAIVARKEVSETTKLPETAMTAAHDEGESTVSALREVMNLTIRGIDPRTIH